MYVSLAGCYLDCWAKDVCVNRGSQFCRRKMKGPRGGCIRSAFRLDDQFNCVGVLLVLLILWASSGDASKWMDGWVGVWMSRSMDGWMAWSDDDE